MLCAMPADPGELSRVASGNLFQDRLRFVATVIGIVFSIVLVTIQLGLFLSFERMVIVSSGTIHRSAGA